MFVLGFFLYFFLLLGVVIVSLGLWQAHWKCVLALCPNLSLGQGNPCRNGSSDKGYLSYLAVKHTEHFGNWFCLINDNNQGMWRERESLLTMLLWATRYKKESYRQVCSIFSFLSWPYFRLRIEYVAITVRHGPLVSLDPACRESGGRLAG